MALSIVHEIKFAQPLRILDWMVESRVMSDGVVEIKVHTTFMFLLVSPLLWTRLIVRSEEHPPIELVPDDKLNITKGVSRGRF